MLCARLGIRVRAVTPNEYSLPLGSLLKAASSQAASPASEFPEPLLLMADFPSPVFHAFLDTLRKNGVRIPLKAVLTSSNAEWDAATLYREIRAEHEAMTARKE